MKVSIKLATWWRPAPSTARRSSRIAPVMVATLGLLAINLSALGIAPATSAGAAPTTSALTLPVTGLVPSMTSPTYLAPLAISCASATTCVATGNYFYTIADTVGFISLGTQSAGAWTWTTSTLPIVGLIPTSNVNPEAYPTAIACATTTQCVVTGYYLDTSSQTDGFVASGTLSGSTWSWTVSTLPTSGLFPAPYSSPNIHPRSLSCASASRCVATGSYSGASNAAFGFTATGTLSGSTWSWVMATLPIVGPTPPVSSPGILLPYGVSCATTTSCVTTGYYSDVSGGYDGFVAAGTLSGSTWSWAVSTLPLTGLSPVPWSITHFYPDAVSCHSASTCVITGSYEDVNQYAYGFTAIGTLSAGTWSWTTSTLPWSTLIPTPYAATNVTPGAISCPTDTACIVAGQYRDSSNNPNAFYSFGTLSGGVWSWAPSSVPAAGLSPASASAIDMVPASLSCPSTAGCLSTGSYVATDNSKQGYVAPLHDLFAASTPTITNLPSGARAGGSLVASVATNGDGVISVVSSTPSVCTSAGLKVTFLTAGTCTLSANVAIGADYLASSGSAQSFTITTAPQAKLTISNKKVAFSPHVRVLLGVKGGSGTGAVSFSVHGARCSLRGHRLSAATPLACTVVATKAGDATYQPRRSAALTFFFGFKNQAPVTLRVSTTTTMHTAKVTLSTSGGSGHGKVHYNLTGAHCTITGSVLRASKATSCVISATKAWSATFLPATSHRIKVTFK